MQELVVYIGKSNIEESLQCSCIHPDLAASNTSVLIPMTAAMSIIVVLPNHIRKFMKPMSDLVPNTRSHKVDRLVDYSQ